MLINNVAMNHAFPVPFIEEDPQLIDNILEVNVRAQLLITRMVLPQMIQRKCGLIINNGSATGSVPCAYLSVYSASKAFLKTWSQALAFEVKSKGVHVEHINTFFVTTRMSKIRKPSFTTPTPSAYARSVLRNIGYATSSSLFPPHALLDWILSYFPEQFKINRGAEMHLAIRKRALKKQQKTQ